MCLEIKSNLCHPLFRNIHKISNDFVLLQKWVNQTSNMLLFISYNPSCDLYKNDGVEFVFASAVQVCEPPRNIIMTLSIQLNSYNRIHILKIIFFGYVTYLRIFYQIFDIFNRKIIWIEVSLCCFPNHGDNYKL